MKWRCVTDKTGYCKGTPEWSKEPHEHKVAGQEDIKGQKIAADFIGGECALNPKTCGKYQGLLEQLDPAELERISKSTYIETIIPISPEEKAKVKPKSKKAEKLEQEIAQGRMF